MLNPVQVVLLFEVYQICNFQFAYQLYIIQLYSYIEQPIKAQQMEDLNKQEKAENATTCQEKLQLDPPKQKYERNQDDIEIIKKYVIFFDKFETLYPIQNILESISPQELKKAKIRIQIKQLNHKRNSFVPLVQIVKMASFGQRITFEVQLNCFFVQIEALFIDQEAPQLSIDKNLFKGTFGVTRKICDSNGAFFIKRIEKASINGQIYTMGEQKSCQFRTEEVQIKDVLKEIAISKVLSLLRIGPHYSTYLGVDLLVFRDCFEFAMESCLSQKQYMVKYQQKTSILQLKENLYKMHKFRLIHKDIKPQNILYSQHFNRFVLCDFGLSHSVNQQQGQKTLTRFEGTKNYMSEEMLKGLYSDTKFYVNLYENDRHCLQKTLEQMQKKYEQAQNLMSTSQMQKYLMEQDYFEHFTLNQKKIQQQAKTSEEDQMPESSFYLLQWIKIQLMQNKKIEVPFWRMNQLRKLNDAAYHQLIELLKGISFSSEFQNIEFVLLMVQNSKAIKLTENNKILLEVISKQNTNQRLEKIRRLKHMLKIHRNNNIRITKFKQNLDKRFCQTINDVSIKGREKKLLIKILGPNYLRKYSQDDEKLPSQINNFKNIFPILELLRVSAVNKELKDLENAVKNLNPQYTFNDLLEVFQKLAKNSGKAKLQKLLNSCYSFLANFFFQNEDYSTCQLYLQKWVSNDTSLQVFIQSQIIKCNIKDIKDHQYNIIPSLKRLISLIKTGKQEINQEKANLLLSNLYNMIGDSFLKQSNFEASLAFFDLAYTIKSNFKSLTSIFALKQYCSQETLYNLCQKLTSLLYLSFRINQEEQNFAEQLKQYLQEMSCASVDPDNTKIEGMKLLCRGSTLSTLHQSSF